MITLWNKYLNIILIHPINKKIENMDKIEIKIKYSQHSKPKE